jgi:hypothetical protein
MPLLLQLTDAGLDAIVAAESGGTDLVRITQLGLTANNFTQAPTLTNLPGEFKRISMISGEPVSPNIIHMTAYDSSTEVYDVRGLGLYLDDGTLLATFVDPDPVFRKAALAFGLFVFDIAFSSAIEGVIEFGNATFLYPPATESTRGTARIATQARVDAAADGADDDETIVTPKTLRARIGAVVAQFNSALAALEASVDGQIAALTASVSTQITDLTNWVNSQISALTASVNAQITALTGRTITGSGLVTGGGDLSANRVLDVAEATAAEIRALAVSKAMTPAAWAGLQRSLAQNGWYELPGGLIIQQGRFTVGGNGVHFISFPLAFPNECFAVSVGGGTNQIIDNNQIELVGGSITSTGFQVIFSINVTSSGAFIAIGR